jgi:DNA-binding helix-hairpin-helix protein with protein kinase domain
MEIRTEKGRKFNLSKKLGQGGQGTAYLVEGKNLVVKKLHSKSPIQKERLRNKLAAIKRMDLSGLPLAKPLEMLSAPHVGYVMEFASGMSPLEALNKPPKENPIAWYQKTGGIKRRIQLLTRISEVLADLHARQIAFGDLSPWNIFISEDPAFQEVFFIDLDNLCRVTHGDTYIYTPGYGAPEVVASKKGISTLSDSYSFAVMAFQLLSQVHPLIGDYVNDGDPELEDDAFRGQIPWIHHAEDPINHCSKGFPRELVTTPKMMKLFDKTFRDGLLEPVQRPDMNAWKEVLETAFNFLVECSGCHQHYFFAKTESECPFCEAPREVPVHYSIRFWENKKSLQDAGCKGSELTYMKDKRQRIFSILGGRSQEIAMTRRHIFQDVGEKGKKVLLRMAPVGNDIVLKVNEPIYLRDLIKGTSKLIERDSYFTKGKFAHSMIHFLPEDRAQRGIMINIGKK